MTTTKRTRKLIEVALPLDEINAASKADKDRKTGTIRNLHKWFAPMPLPAWRALLFAALIDDPEDDNHRVYLLDVIKRLVANGADLPDDDTLDEAKAILAKQFPDGVPTVMDPFCGGGSTLVEAQRLGLPSLGSDLNPVPTLITRTLTELLPRVYNEQPLHPEASADGTLFTGERLFSEYEGLARDVQFYAEQIRQSVRTRLSALYPRDAGETPIAWLWARTAPCPNPACRVDTVLTTSWWLSRKKGDYSWIEPRVIDSDVHLDIVHSTIGGEAPAPPKAGRGATFNCLGCAQPIGEAEIRQFGLDGRLGMRITAVAVETANGRSYRAPSEVEAQAAMSAEVPADLPEISLGPANQYVAPPRYGLSTFQDLYTPRQLNLLAAFSDSVAETRETVISDGGSPEWADAVATILGLAVGQLARVSSTLCPWRLRTSANAKVEAAFSRHDLPIMWDFAETYFESGSVGDWKQIVVSLTRSFAYAPTGRGQVIRKDARDVASDAPVLLACDPPYFDAIGYADLSDYFYMWHRRALRKVHPDLYSTLATPKAGELTAFPWHHGGTRELARSYFIAGFAETFRNLQKSIDPSLPMLVVYASKEQNGGREEETRWSSILTAMIEADLEITGTWPIRGTGSSRMRGIGSNAVATYIVLVCRPRQSTATTSSLADFNRALRRELGPAIRDLQAASILPVDLAQAAMGPGMQIYSRYRAVLGQGGERVPVDQALTFINSALSEVLDEQEGDLDAESRFAVRWWERYGWDPADFGEADKTARPLGISVDDVARAGVVTSRANKVQLLGSGDLDPVWVPSADIRPTAWEAVHHLSHRLIDKGGELEAAQLMTTLGTLQDPAMALVYRLHDIAAKKGRTGDQERYNALINSWAELVRLSLSRSTTTKELF